MPEKTRLARVSVDVFLLFALVASTFALQGCRSLEGEEDSVNVGDPNEAIVVSSMVDMRGVNELTVNTTNFHTAIHYFALFLTLLEEEPDFTDGPPTHSPRLAATYAFSDDRTTLTFHLREDALWSDGMPITAQDVRFTWIAQTHPDVGWGLAGYKRHIRDVEVVDKSTVRFHFDKAYATQLLDANLGVILPEHAWGERPFSEWRTGSDWFLQNLVVSGPFTVESWQPGERLVLRRNERYFEAELPRSERIIFNVTPDQNTQLALLRSGRAHMADWARPSDAELLKADPSLDFKTYLPRGSRALVWNTSRPLFSQRETRLALTLALDRQAIVDALYYGYANLTDSPLPSNVWARDRHLGLRPHDPDRAAKILADQGWLDRDGDGVLDRDGQRFSFEILTVAGNELREDILVMVQDQLRQIGVEARQKVVEFNTLLARERSHDFEVSLSSMGVGTDLDLSFFLHSDSIDGGYNIGAYSNPEIDRLLDELKTRQDPREAKTMFDQLQALIYEDMPITVLYEPLQLVPYNKRLRHISPNALSTYFDLEKWTLDGTG